MKKNSVALGGLFAALHILFLVMSKFIVGSELLLVLFLPLLSTIYTLKSESKNVAMYVIATFLICIVFDFISTFIYVIPSIVCGIIYGVLRKRKFKELELLCVTGIVHMFTIAFSFLVIVLLFKEVDFLDIFEKVFSLKGENLFVVALLTLLVLGFCESFLVHVVTDNEISKFATKVEKNEDVPFWFSFVCIVNFICFIVVYCFNSVFSVFPMVVFFIFFIPYIIEGIINLKYKVITFTLMIVFSLISIFVINYIEPICYLIFPVFILSPMVINNFQDNKRKKLLKDDKMI